MSGPTGQTGPDWRLDTPTRCHKPEFITNVASMQVLVGCSIYLLLHSPKDLHVIPKHSHVLYVKIPKHGTDYAVMTEIHIVENQNQVPLGTYSIAANYM